MALEELPGLAQAGRSDGLALYRVSFDQLSPHTIYNYEIRINRQTGSLFIDRFGK